MKNIFSSLALLFMLSMQISAQESSVKIKLDDEERFRFEDDRLEFVNPGHNVLIGDSAGASISSNPDAGYNVMIGYRAGFLNNAGYDNVFIGDSSGYHNQDGQYNTAVGAWSAWENTNGWSNAFFGAASGAYNTTGIRNSYFGTTSGYYSDTGSYNSFFGYASGAHNHGSYNVFMGRSAGMNNKGDSSVMLGFRAGQNDTASNRLYIANSETHDPLVYGEFNNRILRLNVNRLELRNDNLNTFVGDSTGIVNEGTRNVLLGYKAGYSTQGSEDNVMVGLATGTSTTTGSANTMIGTWAGEFNNKGVHNVFVGYGAGAYNDTASYNVFVGSWAGINNTNGRDNTFLGTSTGAHNTTGRGNTFLGRRSGFYNETGDSNIFIGNRAGFNELGSHKLYIANSDTTTPLIYGEFDNEMLRIHGTLDIKGLYQFPTNDGTTGQALQTDGSGNLIWEMSHGDFSNGGDTCSADRSLGNTDAFGLDLLTNNTSRIHIGIGGKIGIGETSPTASLHIAGNDGILSEGTYNSGLVQSIGAGTRMHFYSRKAAFRSGTVTGTDWDDSEIGNYSVAFGYDTRATQNYSVAMGKNSDATGYAAIAMGSELWALGSYSVAMGYGSIAGRSHSTAIGYNVLANGDYSFAAGQSTVAGSFGSFVIGRHNVANGILNGWVTSDPIFEIGIGSSGSDRHNALTVLKNGNVGIGTATPNTLLEISGNAKADTIYADAFSGNSPLVLRTDDSTRIRINDDGSIRFNGSLGIHMDPTPESSVNKSIQLYASDQYSNPFIYVSGGNTSSLQLNSRRTGGTNGSGRTYSLISGGQSQDVLDRFVINSAVDGDCFTIRNGGLVGIGEGNPTEKLEVGGNILADTVYANAFSSTSPLLLQTDDTTRIYVDDATGNVGIGTTSPGGILDIKGAYHFPAADGDSAEVLKTDGNGNLSWTTEAGDYSNGGEAGGADRSLGNTDDYGLELITNNTSRVQIWNDGSIKLNGSLGVYTDPTPASGVNKSIQLYAENQFSNPFIYVSGGNTSSLQLNSRRTGGTNGSGRTYTLSSGGQSQGVLDRFVINSAVDGDCFTIRNGGFVGIGEGDPSEKLEVGGNILADTVYAGAFSSTSPMELQTDGTTRIYVDDATGDVGIGTTTPSARLSINGSTGYDQLRLQTDFTPDNSSDTRGNTGDVAWDDDYIYIKTSTGWKRSTLSTF